MNTQIVKTTVNEDGSCASVLINMNGKYVASNYVAGLKRTHIVQNKNHTNRLTPSMKKKVESELQKLLDMQSSEWHNMHNEMYSIN